MVEFCSATAVWRHGGMPIVPIRWVLLRDPLGRFSPQALLCTDPTRDPLQIIRWFILRWQIEVTFQEARVHLGVETQRSSDSISEKRYGRATRSALPNRCLDRQLVSQVSSDFRRCPGGRAASDLERDGFTHITLPTQNVETLTGPSTRLGLRALPSRLIGQSRA